MKARHRIGCVTAATLTLPSRVGPVEFKQSVLAPTAGQVLSLSVPAEAEGVKNQPVTVTVPSGFPSVMHDRAGTELPCPPPVTRWRR